MYPSSSPRLPLPGPAARRKEEANIFPSAIVFWTGSSISAYLSLVVTQAGYRPSLWKRKRKLKGTHRGKHSGPRSGTPKLPLLMSLDKSCWPRQAIARSIWLLINHCNPQQEETEINLEAGVPGIKSRRQQKIKPAAVSWF